ncbi:heme-binding domain-containing protein [Aquimarina gracilis]|uniref:Heme-binding domain-containing protein n=1 Tax=Aquimarina gracilis TaxID=874422 RepID=A0ABU5ZYI6_9FLAO|nr:heme-binding domain-containing protein [Aquimarina gracilis]MEB3346962.1 heme-binding domain-containing protein [Aquimarina gracilis]
MKKIFKIIALVLLGVLLIMQFIRPDKNESGYDSIAYFENETQPSDQIRTILKDNCYDCHSNHTIYPWYAEVAPVSYWLADHVEHGREHFNVSDWEGYTNKKKDHKLDELIEEVEEGEMPLNSYTWMHGNLNKEDKEILIQWAKELRSKYSVNP